MSKTPLDHALDLFVFAPLGAAFTARDALPELIDKGRDRFIGPVSSARVMGHLAVSQGQREAERAVAHATDRLAGMGLIPGCRRSPHGDVAEPVAPSDPSDRPAPSGPSGAQAPPVPDFDLDAVPQAMAPSPVAPMGTSPVAPMGTSPVAPTGTAVSADDLAIPGYDSLSAPQVVQRLAGLSTEELDAVRSYEAATRHRKTILTRIVQLQDPSQP